MPTCKQLQIASVRLAGLNFLDSCQAVASSAAVQGSPSAVYMGQATNAQTLACTVDMQIMPLHLVVSSGLGQGRADTVQLEL